MSNNIGFLVVNRRTGYMLEGQNHAARVFSNQAQAKNACVPMQNQMPVALTYPGLVQSLLRGSAFCFDSEDGYVKFVKRLRNDPAHKPFMDFSRERNFVKWRHSDAKLTDQIGVGARVAANPGVQAVPAPQPSVEIPEFNPQILVREGH